MKFEVNLVTDGDPPSSRDAASKPPSWSPHRASGEAAAAALEAVDGALSAVDCAVAAAADTMFNWLLLAAVHTTHGAVVPAPLAVSSRLRIGGGRRRTVSCRLRSGGRC